MKRHFAVLLLASIFLSACGNQSGQPVVLNLTSDQQLYPAFICDKKREMEVTFPNPVDASWSLNKDAKHSVLVRESDAPLEIVWKQNEYQKSNDALGFSMTQKGSKDFEPGKYTFQVTIAKGTNEVKYVGSFDLESR